MEKIYLELLEKCIPLKIRVIFTHPGFTNGASLSIGEREFLHNLAIEMADEDYCITIGGYCFHPFENSYNNGSVLAGIKISKIKAV